MAKTLTVNGETFNYPENRESPGWGEEASAWAEAVTDALNAVVSAGDILQTSAVIANNVSSPTTISGLSFDPTIVRGAVIDFTVYRTTNTSELVETSTAYINNKSVSGVMEIVVVGSGGGGVTLSITSGGQIQYTSTNMSGTGYSGTIKFRARALLV